MANTDGLFCINASAAALRPSYNGPDFMRTAGFLFLISGWVIVLAAVILLSSAALAAFVLVGFTLQLAGLTLVVRFHVIPHGDKR